MGTTKFLIFLDLSFSPNVSFHAIFDNLITKLGVTYDDFLSQNFLSDNLMSFFLYVVFFGMSFFAPIEYIKIERIGITSVYPCHSDGQHLARSEIIKGV